MALELVWRRSPSYVVVYFDRCGSVLSRSKGLRDPITGPPMAFLTRALAQSAFRSRGASFVKADLRRTAKAPLSRTFDVFLSHSFQDAEIIGGVKILLERSGLTVYVDWIEDAHLSRDKVTKATAAKLRLRMRNCKSLIFATSETSPRSKWMPWELGYFDGYRHGHIAILPLVSSVSDTFRGQEYLSLYPYVERLPVHGVSTLAIRRVGRVPLAIKSFPYTPVRPSA